MKIPATMLAAAGLLGTALAAAPAAADDGPHRHASAAPGQSPWLQVAHYDDDDYEYDDDDDDDGYYRHHRKAHKKHRKHKRRHAKRQEHHHEHHHYHEHRHYTAETPRRRHHGRYDDAPYRYERKPAYDRGYDRRAKRGRFAESGVFGSGCHYGLVGSVIGGGLGALVGSQIGDGSGNTAAIIGGTLAGILVGNGVGGYLEQSDRNCVDAALDTADDYETISWHHPQSGDRYEVTPVRSYETRSGRYCREYNTTVVVGGRAERAYGTACRQPDGAWQIEH